MAWPTSLCTVSDIEKEIGHLNFVAQVSDPNSMATETIAQATLEIGDYIKTNIQDIYSRNSLNNIPYTKWILSRGYTWDDTDSILDDITNTTELKRAAVYLSIEKLLTRGITQFKAGLQADPGLVVNEREYWEKKAKAELKAAVHRLKIDFSGDGSITDDERVRTQNVFIRG